MLEVGHIVTYVFTSDLLYAEKMSITYVLYFMTEAYQIRCMTASVEDSVTHSKSRSL